LNIPFFSDSLYLTPELDSGFKLRGDNQKQIAIVYPKTDESKDHLVLLDKILRAAKFNPSADLAIIVFNQDAQLWPLLQKQQIKTVLLFKEKDPSLGLQAVLPYYQVVTLNEVQFIQCHPLSELIQNQDYKKQLWDIIQQTFL